MRTQSSSETASAAAQFGREAGGDGSFVRQPNAFQDRITADGSSGFAAEIGRYHLYVSLACPWAHRALIVRRLLELRDVVTMSVVDPIRDHRGWRFTEGVGHGADPVNGFSYLSEAYLATDSAYEGRVTVPAIWDRVTQRIVTNDFPEITLQFHTEFAEFAKHGVDLYPAELRDEIDAVNAVVYEHVNNGVYKAGFATTQAAHDEAVDELFSTLDALEERLGDQRFLTGNRLTEADIRLFPTLVRFDSVYSTHFKCNVRRLVDYPHLWAYTRDLYQRPAFGATTNFDHIKRHYFVTHDRLNPSRIVPKGPEIDWLEPHDRDRFVEAAPLAAGAR